MLEAIQKQVEKNLRDQGIEAYFIAFEYDDGHPYFAYTFDKNLVEEAQEVWKTHYLLADCWDDYSFEVGFNDIVKDICMIISDTKAKRED